MRLYYAREKALEKINGSSWDEIYWLLYTYKAEVEKASPDSVVEIDYHKSRTKWLGRRGRKLLQKDFFCFKACSNGFLNSCIPYLAVDATALNIR